MDFVEKSQALCLEFCCGDSFHNMTSLHDQSDMVKGRHAVVLEGAVVQCSAGMAPYRYPSVVALRCVISSTPAVTSTRAPHSLMVGSVPKNR